MNKIQTRISIFEDEMVTIIHFQKHEGLEDESAIIFQDAYGNRSVEKILTSQLEERLKYFKTIKKRVED